MGAELKEFVLSKLKEDENFDYDGKIKALQSLYGRRTQGTVLCVDK